MKRNVFPLFLTLALLLSAGVSDAQAQADQNISVELILDSAKDGNKPGNISGTLVIKNTGQTELKVKHPHNRMAVVFIVMNSLGNVISPVGLAKIDPPMREITIKPHTEFKETFPNLEFITGSALFGYELKTGETYRVIAIYRPDGEKSRGIATGEQLFVPQ
jgi:hypothetical protein